MIRNCQVCPIKIMFGRFRTQAEGDDDHVLLLKVNAAAVLKRVRPAVYPPEG